METKCIKDVDEETWRKFRMIAVKNNLKMSLLLKVMLNEFEKRNNELLKDILKSEKNLTDSEAEEFSGLLKKLRKERGFRE
jgi:hypothetical protein